MANKDWILPKFLEENKQEKKKGNYFVFGDSNNDFDMISKIDHKEKIAIAFVNSTNEELI